MEEQKILNIVVKKSNWLMHIVYWLLAASFLFFVFSNRNYDYGIRLLMVSYITLISYTISYFLNRFLITKYLFAGKMMLFAYLIIGISIITVWLIMYSTILIIIYSMAYLPALILPNKDDILILVSGSFLIIIFAAVIHFIKESYRRFLEKTIIEKQKHQTELKLKEANLKLLQGQLHPHFLFNMLNNLYGLVNQDVNSSRDIIVKLSDLLDYMLYECDKDLVLLSKEIQFIENYIKLEKVRHTTDFNVSFDYKIKNSSVQIAPLILFPFVENAFKHGFNDPKNNYIKIELNQDSNRLNFTVENTISDVKFDKYLNQEGKGIGLKNIKDRLELIYNDNYLLKINKLEDRFLVKLTLKLDEK